MNVRIRFPQGGPLQRKSGKNRRAALALGALLGPAALMPYALGLWGLASDLGLARDFGLTGVFSHWQVWIGLGVITHIAAVTLNRYGRGGLLQVPKVLTVFPTRPDTRPQERKGA
jgi:hypothetical protein